MKLIYLNGNSCAGKSTTIVDIMKEREIYHLSYDKLKWGFAGYTPDKHKALTEELLLAVAEKIFALGYNVVCDAGLFRTLRKRIIDLAKKAQYEVFEINLEADTQILETRFLERVASAQANKSTTISNTSLERFRELSEIYQREKNLDAPIFRSDILSIDEIVKEILTYSGI